MRAYALIVLICCIASPVLGAEPYRAAEADWGRVVDGLTMDKGVLGFGSLRLGTTRAQAEKALDKSLTVHKEEVPVCGEWTTALLEHAGVRLSLQFSGNTEEGTLQSVSLDIPRGDQLTNRFTVITRLKKRIPGLVFVPSMHEPELSESEVWSPVYSPRENPKQAVMLILPFGRTVVTLTECLE